MSKWLAAEGVLGLIWEGGRWFSSPAAQGVLGSAPAAGGNWQVAGGSGAGNGKRDIRSKEKGAVYVGPPHRWVYPNLIEVDGTTYTDGGADGVVRAGDEAMEDMVYKDSTGTILNLTDIRAQLLQ